MTSVVLLRNSFNDKNLVMDNVWNKKFVVLDTETTGFKPQEGHRIIEIGAVRLNGFNITEQYQCYINPERDVPDTAFQVHGLSAEFLKKFKTFKDIVDDFLNFIGNDPLIIHNSEFDLNFINHHLMELSYPTLRNHVVDTVVMARTRFPNMPNSLDALCRRFNIDISERTQHGALKDSLLLAEVWRELNGGIQATLNLSDDLKNSINQNQHQPITNTNFNSALTTDNGKIETTIETVQTTVIPKRQFAIDKLEQLAHEKLITEKLAGGQWTKSRNPNGSERKS